MTESQREKRATIRSATEADLPRIVKNYARLQERPWDPFSSVERLNAIPHEGLLVAEAEGNYAGFLYWFEGQNPWFDKRASRFAHIVECHVLREYAEWLTGPLLVAEALKRISEKGYPTVYVDTPEHSALEKLLSKKVAFVGHLRYVRLRYDLPKEKKYDHAKPDELRMLQVFLVELYEQCRLCLTAYDELVEIIDHPDPKLWSELEGKRLVQARIWSRIQAIVVASTVITKILWPNPAPRKNGSDRKIIERGLKIRTVLRMRFEDPPGSKWVRNAFEHIDEILDEWQKPYSLEGIPPGWILSAFDIGKEPPGAENSNRYFHLYSKELRVGDARCNLQEVIDRVRDIQKKLPPEAQIFLSPPDGWDPEKREWRK